MITNKNKVGEVGGKRREKVGRRDLSSLFEEEDTGGEGREEGRVGRERGRGGGEGDNGEGGEEGQVEGMLSFLGEGLIFLTV